MITKQQILKACSTMLFYLVRFFFIFACLFLLYFSYTEYSSDLEGYPWRVGFLKEEWNYESEEWYRTEILFSRVPYLLIQLFLAIFAYKMARRYYYYLLALSVYLCAWALTLLYNAHRPYFLLNLYRLLTQS